MKRNILLGISGGIASYKSCELVRLLIKSTCSVQVVMTPSAEQFVTPLVFQTLSQKPVYRDMFTIPSDHALQHITLAQWTSLCVIAPATANTISKMACGICDNLLTTVVCALPEEIPVLIVPGMNHNMWKNPAIQENCMKLESHKNYTILPPVTGELACGVYGAGRMAEPKDIFERITTHLEKL